MESALAHSELLKATERERAVREELRPLLDAIDRADYADLSGSDVAGRLRWEMRQAGVWRSAAAFPDERNRAAARLEAFKHAYQIAERLEDIAAERSRYEWYAR